MRRQVATLSLSFGLWMLAAAGCVDSKVLQRITTLEESNKKSQQTLDETNSALSSLISEFENDRRRASREKYCKSPEVTQFMTDLQDGIPDTCNADSMSNALTFMRQLPCGIAHLQPEAGLSSLKTTRLGQIRGILEADKLHAASTRLVVMAKPAEDTEAGRKRAKDLANEFVSEVVRKALPPPRTTAGKSSAIKTLAEIPVMGPYLLPCQLRQNISELYKKAFFRPISGEPSLGKPAVVLFVFVSDC